MVKTFFLLYMIWMLIYIPRWFSLDNLPLTLVKLFFGYFNLWYVVGGFYASIILYFIRNLEFKSLIGLAFSLYFIG